jgi:hypothetical protein
MGWGSIYEAPGRKGMWSERERQSWVVNSAEYLEEQRL